MVLQDLDIGAKAKFYLVNQIPLQLPQWSYNHPNFVFIEGTDGTQYTCFRCQHAESLLKVDLSLFPVVSADNGSNRTENSVAFFPTLLDYDGASCSETT